MGGGSFANEEPGTELSASVSGDGAEQPRPSAGRVKATIRVA